MAQEPRLDEAHDRIICVDNIPKVGTDKKDKLKSILQKLLTSYGRIVNEHYPESDDGVLKGYLFVEYENGAAATEACAQLNGYRLDKAHSFKCNFVSDFDKYKQMNLTEANTDMTATPYKNPGILHWFLTNADAYDQFCLLHNDMFTSVFLNSRNQPTLLKSREVCLYPYTFFDDQSLIKLCFRNGQKRDFNGHRKVRISLPSTIVVLPYGLVKNSISSLVSLITVFN